MNLVPNFCFALSGAYEGRKIFRVLFMITRFNKMSKATKRKQVQEDLSIPTESQTIVQLVDARGNNLHEVMEHSGERYLVSMPMKFRKNIWVKRGDYILVEPIPEGDKVKAEIAKILTKEHINYYRSEGCWPNKFDDSDQLSEGTNQNENDSAGGEKDIFVNTNRRIPNYGCYAAYDGSSSETSDSE
ncbi:probable RNA-binding protein EIF1AD [Diachasma alloeum]|uniref:probable RNA-binding protein EIF1AD n=1 Tax=Diachasma alloeum TaxID=454923 RepID=UPI000738511D|nr:probable RNA-binding protein EIF1AD [Diachasma alloeum]